MAITARIPTTRTIEFFSKTWWRFQNDIVCSSFRQLKSDVRRDLFFTNAHGHPEIVGHDQRADQEQGSACGPDDIEWVHGFDGFDEGVLKEPERRVSAPHQSLQDSRHPHRGDVENDADGRDPEVPID